MCLDVSSSLRPVFAYNHSTWKGNILNKQRLVVFALTAAERSDQHWRHDHSNRLWTARGEIDRLRPSCSHRRPNQLTNKLRFLSGLCVLSVRWNLQLFYDRPRVTHRFFFIGKMWTSNLTEVGCSLHGYISRVSGSVCGRPGVVSLEISLGLVYIQEPNDVFCRGKKKVIYCFSAQWAPADSSEAQTSMSPRLCSPDWTNLDVERARRTQILCNNKC